MTEATHLRQSDSRPSSERRARRDRRANGGDGRRGGSATWWHRLWSPIARDLAAIGLLVAAIGVTVSHVRPIYAGRAPLAQELTQRIPGSATIGRSPADSTIEERAVASPQFEADRRAFAADLVRTGRLSQARADSIAFYAVREAYIRGIPPAVIFGVMLTENAVFASNATSNVGAVGLMQIYPKIWLKELGSRFGHDLSSDSTNLKYGTYILSEYINPRSGSASPQQVNKGLLRYNGCVRGTNTPNCRTYPNKVKTYVEREAQSLCGDKSFYDCIAKPVMVGLLDGLPGR